MTERKKIEVGLEELNKLKEKLENADHNLYVTLYLSTLKLIEFYKKELYDTERN